MRRAVHASISFDSPPLEMAFECREAGELEPGDRVVLHVAHARFGLALGASTIRSARCDGHAPVAAERREGRMDAYGAGLPIFSDDERTRAIDQDLLRDTAEATERSGETFTPVVLPLAQRCTDEDPARVAEHGNEEEHAHHRCRDADPLLAEVDLHLMAWGG